MVHSLLKISADSAQEEKVFELDQVSFRRLNTRLCKGSVVIAFCMSIAVVCINLLATPWAPQFYVKLNDIAPTQNETASQLLVNIREGLHMITFLAQDLTLDFDNYGLVDTIDTFEEQNLYTLSYNWFNKHHLLKGDQKMRVAGLDLFTNLVSDIGAQLANVSKAEDPSKVIQSIVVTYHHTIMNLDEMHADAKKTGVYPGHFDEDTLRIGAGAHRMKNYARLMTNYPLASGIVSVLSFLTLAFVFFRCQKGCVNPVILLVGALVALCQLGFQFASWASEFRYYNKLHRLLKTGELGQIGAAYGYHLIQVVLICCLVIHGLMTYVYVKYRTK